MRIPRKKVHKNADGLTRLTQAILLQEFDSSTREKSLIHGKFKNNHKILVLAINKPDLT